MLKTYRIEKTKLYNKIKSVISKQNTEETTKFFFMKDQVTK